MAKPNVAPSPGLDSTQTRPWCAPTMAATIVRDHPETVLCQVQQLAVPRVGV